jgi:hypothetical protein
MIRQVIIDKLATLQRIEELCKFLTTNESTWEPLTFPSFKPLRIVLNQLATTKFNDSTSKLVNTLYQAKFNPESYSLVDETCEICEAIIPYNGGDSASCQNGHQFGEIS